MKLNLGCGQHKIEGFLNVDVAAASQPDILHDLNQTPWPFKDSSAEEIWLIHALEHLGPSVAEYFAIWQEIYRISKPNALLRVVVPHPRHDSYLNDPTHIRPITPAGLELFSKQRNRDWAANKNPNSPLGLYLDIDIAIENVGIVPDEAWHAEINSGKMDKSALMDAARRYNNVIREYDIRLRVLK